MTHLPKTPKFLAGVINLRGEVLPVIDQRRRFGMPAFGGAAARRRLVVLRSARHRAGLIVDEVTGVLAVPESAVAPAPDLTGEPERLVQAVLNLPESGRMLLLLNQDELLSRTEQKLLDRFAATADP
jgi:purine-binding chemotaxis protein CheW